MKKYQKNVCHLIANHYGIANQMPIAIEEMSELTKEICKYIRGNDNLNDIVEEIADVQIMVEQLISLFGIESKVNEMIDYKMLRQMQRMEQESK